MQEKATIILSTAYLPPIEYFAYLVGADNSIIEKEESYPKQTYRNRCRILTANGPLSLSIPVVKTHGNNTKTKDIEIINSGRWYINHWRAINSAYSGSPFFLYYQDDLQRFFTGEFNNLLEFNTALTNEILKLIGIKSELSYSESFLTPEGRQEDHRYSITPKKEVVTHNFPEYIQVFSSKFSFVPNLSIIDLLTNLGPESLEYLKSVNKALNQKL